MISDGVSGRNGVVGVPEWCCRRQEVGGSGIGGPLPRRRPSLDGFGEVILGNQFILDRISLIE